MSAPASTRQKPGAAKSCRHTRSKTVSATDLFRLASSAKHNPWCCPCSHGRLSAFSAASAFQKKRRVRKECRESNSGDTVFRDDVVIQIDAQARFLRHADVAVHDGELLLRQRLPQGPLLHAVLEVMRVGQRRDEV